MKSPRTRRAPEVVRTEAIACARRLLLSGGPGAVTLNAIARDMGMRHGNLTHHFGSAAALQAALIDAMAQDLTRAVLEAVQRIKNGGAAACEIADIVYDALEREGAGKLIAWLASSGETAQLAPFFRTIGDLVAQLSADAPQEASPIAELTLTILLPALGSALIGAELSAALGLKPGTARRFATAQLTAAIQKGTG